MTNKQLVLINHVLEQVKEGKKPSISNSDKVDLDDVVVYFGNLLLDVDKQIKRGKVRNGEGIAYRLLIEIKE